MNIAARVIKEIAEVSGFSIEEINPESNIYADLGCDSLDHIGILMEFEDQFKCSINDDEFMRLKTVQQLVDHIRGIAGVSA